MSLRTLYQALLDSEPARLRVIAGQWEISLTASRRTDLAAELADAMAHVERVTAAWDSLTPRSRAALEDLLRREGALPWPAFTRRWGPLRTVGPGRLEREELWRDPISATETLWYWGFLYRTSTVSATGATSEMAFVPDDLALYLPAPPPLEIPPPDPASSPLRMLGGDDSLADDLVSLWSLLQNEAVRPDEDGSWPPRHRERLLARVHPPAGPRLALLETLAREVGWIRRDERGLLRPVPDPMLEWLHADRWTQWERLVHAWQESERWNDVAWVPGLQPDTTLGWPNDPLATRSNVLVMLRRCVTDVWYTMADFVTHAHQHTPDFLRLDGDYEAWSPRDAVTGAPLRGFDAWETVEGALLAFLITGPLYWLGLVDLGKSTPWLPPDRFRVSAAGAALLGAADPPTFLEPAPIEVRVSGLLLVPPERRYERFQMSRIATPVGEEGLHLYRLTPRSLKRARRQRIPLERIEGFLEEALEQPLPTTLRQAIEETYRGGGEARMMRGWILRVQDAELLDADAVRDLIQERLGPQVALVREADREQLLRILALQGILPEVEELT
ncbi:MAG: helicase-associated domain-containing protein [Anaerolineales bacterium]